MAKSVKLRKDFKDHIEGFKKHRNTPEEKATIDFIRDRRDELQEHRRGKKIERIWRAADKAYIPHDIESTHLGKKVFASDDEKGLRSQQVIIGSEDAWQETSVPVNPYIKIQTALGIIVDRNPTAVMNPGAKKYQRNTALMENLYTRNWEIAKSMSACLKPFVFNAAKYGIGIGRTFPLTLNRNLRNGDRYTYYDDVFRESLSPWQVWFDDAAVVGNPMSLDDNIYYKDYSWDKFTNQFGHLPRYKNVMPVKQVLLDDRKLVQYDSAEHKGKIAKYQIRVWFYESLERDLFAVITDDDVPLVISEIPKIDRNKKLSLWSAPWTLRNDKDLEGIGIYEAMRNDHKIHTKYRNMTVDQTVLSIYKEFFYEGTDTLQESGIMKTAPGRGRQVINPQNMKWNEVPGPGNDAYAGMEIQERAMEEASGITKGLSGEVTGSTAFETAQARESALKRLKTPLDHITDALEEDAFITLGIMEDLYGVPKIKLVAEDRYIELEEAEELLKNEDFDQSGLEEEFRELPLNVEKNGEGEIIQTDEEQFHVLNPDDLPWEGTIKINGQSVIASSEILERVSTVEMSNLLIPLFQMPPMIAEKPAREIIKGYDKDPEDWLPEIWINPPQPEGQGGNPLFVSQEEAALQEEGGEDQVDLKTGIDTVVPQNTINSPGSAAGNLNNSIKRV